MVDNYGNLNTHTRNLPKATTIGQLYEKQRATYEVKTKNVKSRKISFSKKLKPAEFIILLDVRGAWVFFASRNILV